MSNKYESMTRDDLLAEVNRMHDGIEHILKENHFPFIIMGMKNDLRDLVE